MCMDKHLLQYKKLDLTVISNYLNCFSKSPVGARGSEHTVYSSAETEKIIRNVANCER